MDVYEAMKFLFLQSTVPCGPRIIVNGDDVLDSIIRSRNFILGFIFILLSLFFSMTIYLCW